MACWWLSVTSGPVDHHPLANSRWRNSTAVHPASERTTRPLAVSCNPASGSGITGQLMPTSTSFPRGRVKPVVNSTPPLLIFTVRPCSAAWRVPLPCHFQVNSPSLEHRPPRLLPIFCPSTPSFLPYHPP